MSRFTVPSVEAAPEGSKATLAAIHKSLGVVPNLFRLMANSPAVLNGYASLNGALSKALDVKMRERIALAVAQVNGCDYCLSAHSYIGLNMAKITQDEINLNRKGESGDPKGNAAVRFAAKVAKERGHVTEADIAAVKEAGFTEAQVIEIVALVADNVFTNFLNEVAKTDIDFPVIKAEAA